MRLKNLDIILAVVIAIANIAWTLFPDYTPIVGMVLALPLVFFIPGYMLTKIFFYKRSLDISHLLLLSLGLNVSIDILGGLVLNLLPWGLQRISWAAFLGILTLVFSLMLMYFRRQGQAVEVLPVRFHFPLRAGLLLTLASVVAILALLYASIGAAEHPYPGFTQFWMLPMVQTGQSCTVRLGVHSFEATPVTYQVTIIENRKEVSPSTPVRLNPNQEWNKVIEIAPVATDNIDVEAQLYRTDKPELIYRKADVTFSNALESNDGTKRACGNPQMAAGFYSDVHNNYAEASQNRPDRVVKESLRNIW